MPEPVEVSIQPCLLPPDNATAAQAECYADRCEDYGQAVKACIVAGGSASDIQNCINTARNNYIATIGVCDTL